MIQLPFGKVCHTGAPEVFDAQDPLDGVYGDLPGIPAYSGDDGPTREPDIDLSFTSSGDTWNDFRVEHNRYSFDEDAILTSATHYCPSGVSCPSTTPQAGGTTSRRAVSTTCGVISCPTVRTAPRTS